MKYDKNFYQIRSNEVIFDRLKREIDTVGYYRLPFAEVDYITEFAKRIDKKYIVIIGIGGSSLGASAIYEFLKRKQNFEKKLLFLESTDPVDIKSKFDVIEMQDALFLLISKSGTTVETISIFKYISTKIVMDSSNTVVISGKDTILEVFATTHKMPFFELADNVGGRFSVFSVVGLLPLAILGVDIANMLKGAQKVYESFFSQSRSYDILMEKARFIVENKNRFNINVLFSYSPALEGFNKWYIQLWAESLGKININGTRQGLTPIGLVGPVDQHSFLQLIMEGTRDKTVTFIKVADFEEQITIPSKSIMRELAYLEDVSFSKLIDMQADATIEAIREERDIPFDVITIDKVDEYNIAELMYSYELLVSIIGSFIQIDTYGQPGVENGKIILKQMIQEL
ncbi:Glucose-6-phosphate isomerase [hydrothermal vent metagenome]|uniref:Glucose-6-phosphate isomerase n=1 Tax=hydrothermal vent metagenome TaxID=652676 RepID=A0A1W1CDD6_9ZZZZ